MKIWESMKEKLPKKKRTLWLLALAAVLAVSSFWALGSRKADGEDGEDILYTLSRGDIEISISGSGSVFSAETQELDPDDFEAEVLAIHFNEGDTVKAGDLLYELESDELQALWRKAKVARDNAVLDYQTVSTDVGELTVRAPSSGTIETLDIEVGETLKAGETVVEVWDKAQVYVKTPVNLAHKGKVQPGQSAVATFPSSFAVYRGEVAIVEATPTSDGSGGLFQYVYVAIDNPGGLLEGEKAAVQIHTETETVRGTTEGVVTYKEPEILESPGEAKVLKVLKKEKDEVKAGEVIAVMESDALKIQQMNRDVTLQEAQIDLDEVAEKIGNLLVRASRDGILAGQDVFVGNLVGRVESGTGTTDRSEGTLGQVDSLQRRITIAVDELDINQVAIGQKAAVTVDAAPGETFQGEVVKISELGTVQSGVTTYDVTVSIPYDPLVKVGMTADVEITLAAKTDVVLLPIEAVTTAGNRKLVAVVPEGSDEKTMVPVETGLMDDRYYEVASGLSEGDQVVLTGLSSSVAAGQTTRPAGMMPVMGGGGTGTRPNGGGVRP